MLKMDGLPEEECAVSKLCFNSEISRPNFSFTKAAKLLRVMITEGADVNKTAPGTKQSPIVNVCKVAAQPGTLKFFNRNFKYENSFYSNFTA